MIALLAAWLAPDASACGPDFPVRLLENRVAVLMSAPEGVFGREAALVVSPRATGWPVGTGTAGEQRRVGLTPDQVGLVETVAAAPSFEEAQRRGRDLPEDLRHYGEGAYRYHAELGDRGRQSFERVVSLPAGERTRRGTWARYMLGRMAATPAEAREHYEALRAEVSAGAADPMGLAVASLGEEARTHLPHDPRSAALLYAEQAALGSPGGLLSLRFVLQRFVASACDAQLTAWVTNTNARQLLLVFLWTRGGLEERSGPRVVTRARLLGALESAGVGPGPRESDQLASIAYQAGQWAVAEGYAAQSTSPLSWWVRAKLALRDGDPEAAAAAYAQAVPGFPLQEVWRVAIPSEYGPVWTDMPVHHLVSAEQGLLALSRGDYTAALRGLLAAVATAERPDGWTQGWEDAAHVAERVLTADELVAFVSAEGAALPAGVRAELRALLGRRLMREGRASEAVAYFDEAHVSARARAVADALRRTQRGQDVDRAEAWLEAAEMTRHGLDLYGTAGAPDYGVYEGVYERWSESTLVPDDPDWVGHDEVSRIAASALPEARRFHYRQVASGYAEAAADLLPADSQAFAVSLCRATQYVIMRGPQSRVDELYLRYVREGPLYEGSGSFGQQCPEPDFEGLRARLAAAWWAQWGPVGAAGLGLLLIVGAAVAIRRARDEER